MRSAASSAVNLNSEEYDRKLNAFNHKRPWGNRMNQTRISSWSDPVSAREILDGDDSEDSMSGDEGSSGVMNGSRPHRTRARGGSRLARASILESEEPVLYEEPSEAAGYLSDAAPLAPPKRRPTALGPRR